MEQEATQLLAATEYARSEAISQGVPMSVWIDPATGSFGVRASDGFDGDNTREKAYALHTDLRFDSVEGVANQDGHRVIALFEPEGTLDPESSLDTLRIVHRNASVVCLEQTEDGWGYEIVKEAP